MKITTSGIDVAKSVFQVHGVDGRGNVVLRRQIRRSQLVLFFSKLEPCLIGMEACASSHYWARKLAALGHTVRLMAPQFVKPYRKNDKNDGNDAEAICEARAASHALCAGENPRAAGRARAAPDSPAPDGQAYRAH